MNTLFTGIQSFPTICSLAWLLCVAPLAGQAEDFTYATNNGTITITSYTGPGGEVVIPATIVGLPVTRIGYMCFFGNTTVTGVVLPNSLINIENFAFFSCASLSSVELPKGLYRIGAGAFAGTGLLSITIPRGVTNIASGLTMWGYYGAFSRCANLGAITVDPLNPTYADSDGVLFTKDFATLVQYPDGKSRSYAIPHGVTTIGGGAFTQSSITNLIIPTTVTTIEDGAVADCSGPALCFLGDAPPHVGPDAFYAYFGPPQPYPTAYYLPGTTGWGPMLADAKTALWYLPHPVILDFGPSFGVQNGRFGFRISWATNAAVAIEGTATLASSSWLPLATNALAGGWSYFADPDSTNYWTRFYRLRWP